MLRHSLALLLAALALGALSADAQQTPPIAPRIQETPLPPRVEVPPPPVLPPDVPNRPLTADEAARIALRNQPNVLVARSGVTAAQGRTQQTRSGLLPNVSVSAGYTHVETIHASAGGGAVSAGGIATGVSASGYTGSINLRQLLFDFNHVRDTVRESSALERSAADNLTRVESDTVLQVKQAFYGYLQDERLVTVNATNVRNQQAHLALAQARLQAGLGLPSDVVRAETAVADAILNLNLAQNNASVARVNLALLMGVDPRTPIQPAEEGEPSVAAPDVEALVRTALAHRPEVNGAQANLEAAQYGVSAAKTTNTPSVAASLGLFSRGSDLSSRTDTFTIGVALQFSPFDGGLTAGRVREARANVVSAQAQRTSAELSVTSDVSQAYLNLRTAEQRVLTADAEVANAEESVRLAEGRYRSGLGTFIEVTDAQAALLTAQTNRVNAQSAVDQARAALAHAIGTPLPAVPTPLPPAAAPPPVLPAPPPTAPRPGGRS